MAQQPAQQASAPHSIATPSTTATKPLAIEITKAPDSKVLDPHWTAYLQATATPVVALIAGYIAYQQWRTAKNKLKLDLFEKRLKVYEAAIELTKALAHPEAIDWNVISDAAARMSPARWLFNAKVERHLTTLVVRAYETADRGKLDTAHMTTAQKLELVHNTIRESGGQLMQDLQELGDLMGDYLELSH